MNSTRRCKIQERLLPQQIPHIDGWELAVSWQPASGVGGDCFDTIRLRRHAPRASIADVVGKGIPAALLMTNLQAAVRAFATEAVEPRRTVSAGESHPVRQHRRRTLHQLLLLPCSTRPTASLDLCERRALPADARPRRRLGRAPGHRRPGARRLSRRRVRAGAGRRRRAAIGSCSSPTASPRRAAQARRRIRRGRGCSRRCVAHRACSAPALQARLADAVAAFTGGRLQDDATLMVLAADQG